MRPKETHTKSLDRALRLGMIEIQTLADRIFKQNDRYNESTALIDMFLHGEQDIVYEIHKKIRRADSLIRSGKSVQALDSFVDIVNYAKMGGAFCLLGEASKHESEKVVSLPLERVKRRKKRKVSAETRAKISASMKKRRKEMDVA